MGAMNQKKFTISNDQKEFLEDFKKWGFSDQSSIVREALDHFMTELKAKKYKDTMAKKAQELLALYSKDKEITIFTALDGEDLL